MFFFMEYGEDDDLNRILLEKISFCYSLQKEIFVVFLI